MTTTSPSKAGVPRRSGAGGSPDRDPNDDGTPGDGRYPSRCGPPGGGPPGGGPPSPPGPPGDPDPWTKRTTRLERTLRSAWT